jgi:uncharacterized protein with HEPN domain
MRQACAKVERYTRGLSLDDFRKDEKTYDAVVRNLEVIGEAAKFLPQDVRDQVAQIDWRKVSGLRNVIAHAYFGIDDAILWNIVTTKIPELADALRQLDDDPS